MIGFRAPSRPRVGRARGHSALPAVWLGCALLIVPACVGRTRVTPDWGPPPPKPSAEAKERTLILRDVRAALNEGNGELAARILAPLVESESEDFSLARLHQDALCLGASEGELLRLLRQARERAESSGRAVDCLLAARLEKDPASADTWLQRAAADPRHGAWVHYAQAHLDALRGDWTNAATSLMRALAIDPTHLAARRMEAALLARRGQRRSAIAALKIWIERTKANPLVSKRERDHARIDLAQMLILENQLSDARVLLEELKLEPGSRARGLAVQAALFQARGENQLALETCRQAQAADPRDPLPAVQEALLLESQGRPLEQSLAAWRRVLELSQRGELGDLLLGLQARVSIERTATPREAVPKPGASQSVPAAEAPLSGRP